MESNQKIFAKIDEMYNLLDDKGAQKNKAFFSHLIKAYLPLKSVGVALVNPESKKVRVRCVFTKKELITVEKAKSDASTDSLRNNIDDFVGTFDAEKGCFLSTTPMSQMFGGKVLAIQGKDTKTYMSQESYATFVNWVMTQYIGGDGHIKWLINQMKGGLHPGIVVKKRKPISKNSGKSKTYSTPGAKAATFGDLSALQALKDKFKEEE
jgi:hypothetical protein